jgi:hypothetical protein
MHQTAQHIRKNMEDLRTKKLKRKKGSLERKTRKTAKYKKL